MSREKETRKERVAGGYQVEGRRETQRPVAMSFLSLSGSWFVL